MGLPRPEWLLDMWQSVRADQARITTLVLAEVRRWVEELGAGALLPAGWEV